MDFKKVAEFHGHVCPGLALGYRVALCAAEQLDFVRSSDEELVAVVENNSCAVDAIQMVLGCTFGKGNFIFKDFGKQVYTFHRRESGDSLRIAVQWRPPVESDELAEQWRKFRDGDRSADVVAAVADSKQRKVKLILEATNEELFVVSKGELAVPPKAVIYQTVTCSVCGEKCMEPKSVLGKDGAVRCLPCADNGCQ